MSRRELFFAAALAVCSAVVTFGMYLVSVPAGFITGGLLFGGWSWLVLAE